MQIETNENFFDVLEAARIRKGLSERQLSALINMSPTHYWFFKNKTKNMTIDTLLKYCTVLGLKITIG